MFISFHLCNQNEKKQVINKDTKRMQQGYKGTRNFAGTNLLKLKMNARDRRGHPVPLTFPSFQKRITEHCYPLLLVP